jgi:hypothetical protein
MVTGSGKRAGQPKLGDGPDRSGCRPFDPRLSLQPPDPKGSEWDPSLWNDLLDSSFNPSMRNADGGSTAGSKGADNKPAVPRDSGGLRAGSQRNGRDDYRSKAGSVQDSEIIKLAELPDVPDGYWESPQEAVTGVASDGLRDELTVLGGANQLDRIVSKSLDVIEEVLDQPLPATTDERYMKILSMKQSAATSAMAIGLKADENRFRARKNDVLGKLLAEIKANDQAKMIENIVPSTKMPTPYSPNATE